MLMRRHWYRAWRETKQDGEGLSDSTATTGVAKQKVSIVFQTQTRILDAPTEAIFEKSLLTKSSCQLSLLPSRSPLRESVCWK